MRRMLPLVALLLASTASAQTLRERMLLAEDARPATQAGLAPLVEGLKQQDPALRRQAVRALGRLERGDLVATVAPALTDPDAGVRAEACDALAQLATAANVSDVQNRLLERVASENHLVARGAAAASLGRLPYVDAAQVARAEQALVPLLSAREATAATVGAARGLEALVRVSRKVAVPSPATIEALLSAAGREGGDEPLVAVRRLAWLALIPLNAVDQPRVESGLGDPDDEVRRLAAAAAGSDATFTDRAALVRRALADSNGRVRYEALRVWGRQLQKTSCRPIVDALRDSSPHVRLQAIDLLASPCPDAAPAETLRALAEVLTTRPGEWHAPAHAIVSLARVDPDRARSSLPRYLEHGTWQVRMYAARAAAALRDVQALRSLGQDAHDNVREAALAGLVELERPEAAAAALGALATRRDYQLLLTAARALSTQAGLLPADQQARARQVLADALTRVSAEERDTSRDPRMAMLDRLKELGPAEQRDGPAAKALEARLTDFDPAVARRAADVLGAWTGTPQRPAPKPARAPLNLSRLAGSRDIRVAVTMAGRGTFTMRMLLDEAPLSVARVLTLAEKGYYNGLTFHRVAPNFVIQGGSPGANEYVGDGPFMRDEPGLRSHRRATVGISTRGRDTGDAQLFVNLIDSPRLDHIYTVLAEVVDGMDVVDAIVEGDVIEGMAVQDPR